MQPEAAQVVSDPSGWQVSGLPSGQQPYSLEAWENIPTGGPNAQGLVGYGAYGKNGQVNVLRLDGPTGLYT